MTTRLAADFWPTRRPPPCQGRPAPRPSARVVAGSVRVASTVDRLMVAEQPGGLDEEDEEDEPQEERLAKVLGDVAGEQVGGDPDEVSADDRPDDAREAGQHERHERL